MIYIPIISSSAEISSIKSRINNSRKIKEKLNLRSKRDVKKSLIILKKIESLNENLRFWKNRLNKELQLNEARKNSDREF